MRYKQKTYPYRPPQGLTTAEDRKKVIIVGAGPVGLAAAIELSNHGIPTVVLDDNNQVSTGSRAICWSKRSLEIFDRLGIGDRAVDKGVVWKVGRTYHRGKELFNFDLLPEKGHKRPAFINLQQYYVEQYLLDRAEDIELIELRYLNRVVGLDRQEEYVAVGVDTPDGSYRLECEYLIACDGASSSIRNIMELEFEGELFEERFLIADIELEAEFPSERRFWFEPDFHSGQSALLHKQPDNIYRIDLQLGWGADPVEECKPENVAPRIEKVVGTDDFRIDWVSVYAFQCRRLSEFVHGRVLFAGDSAHIVSPFGARGGNSGLQDIDNLCWKLAAVIDGRSPSSILESYNSERTYGADENIANSTRTTKFMTPANGMERVFRDQLLKLASRTEFARAWVNSGRLSVPCVYPCEEDQSASLPRVTRPGSVVADAPSGDGWLIDMLGGDAIMLGINADVPKLRGAASLTVPANRFLRSRYLGGLDSLYCLVRPDQVIAKRWENPDVQTLQDAVDKLWKGEL